jgi:hypothetical protein
MQRLILFALAINLVLAPSAFPDKAGKGRGNPAEPTVKKSAVIWRQPSDIGTRNLFYGQAGRAGQPRAPFRFVKEDRDGGSPKFVVRDARGVEWKVKLGDEARPETTATRLLWAVGYFTDVNYYLPRLRVAGLPKLSRGEKYVSAGGVVHGARLERTVKKLDDWSWFENPFIGTKEFDGLRVMMALMNKWDLKQVNNAVYDVRGSGLRYLVSDLGDCFGKTGGDGSRSKGNVEDYIQSRFIEDVTPAEVDLVLHSRPPIFYAVAVPYYVKRVRMEKISDHIPRAHARWMGSWLGRLTNSQIADAFRAAGYSPSEVDAYTRKVRERISQLNAL